MKRLWTILALAGSVLLFDVGSASAQRPGRGGARGNVSLFSMGLGQGVNSYGSRYGNSYSAARAFSPYNRGFGYSYGYTPYNYGYTRSFYSASPTYYPAPIYYDATPSVSVVPATYLEPMTAVEQSRATITVFVPTTETLLWFGTTRMDQSGTERVFQSPALDSGSVYSYLVRAQWTINGRSVEQTQKVLIRAGQNSTADFRDSAPEPQRLK